MHQDRHRIGPASCLREPPAVCRAPAPPPKSGRAVPAACPLAARAVALRRLTPVHCNAVLREDAALRHGSASAIAWRQTGGKAQQERPNAEGCGGFCHMMPP